MASKSGVGMSPMVQPIAMRFAARLLAIPLLVGVGLRAHGARAADDWFTMNKDYSAPRYVDLDEINKDNVGNLKEVCEVGLNQPVLFSSDLLMAEGTPMHIVRTEKAIAEYGFMPLMNMWWPQTRKPRKPIASTA